MGTPGAPTSLASQPRNEPRAANSTGLALVEVYDFDP
jgi:hypothetical protein